MIFQLFDCFSNPHKLLQNQLYILLILLCFSLNYSNYSNNTIMANSERTFIMCKPDAVHRGIVGEIIKRFEAKGFKLVAMKFMWVSTDPILYSFHNLKISLTLSYCIKYTVIVNIEPYYLLLNHCFCLVTTSSS